MKNTISGLRLSHLQSDATDIQKLGPKRRHQKYQYNNHIIITTVFKPSSGRVVLRDVINNNNNELSLWLTAVKHQLNRGCDPCSFLS